MKRIAHSRIILLLTGSKACYDIQIPKHHKFLTEYVEWTNEFCVTICPNRQQAAWQKEI